MCASLQVCESLSRVLLFVTPWPEVCQASLFFTTSQSLLRLMSIEWCHPTISSSVTPFSWSPQTFPHQGLFQRVTSSHQVAKELELQLKNKSFQWIFRVGFLEDWLLWYPCNWEAGSHFLLQRILPTQEGKPGLLHCRQILYRLSHQGSPKPWALVRSMVLAPSKTTRCLDWCTIFSIYYKGHLGKDIKFSRHQKTRIRSNLEGVIDRIWEKAPELRFPLFFRYGQVYTAT